MGTGRRRSTIAAGPEWQRLAALVRAGQAGGRVDPAELEDLIRTLGAQPGRMRFAEGARYNDACALYESLTGQALGPVTGTY